MIKGAIKYTQEEIDEAKLYYQKEIEKERHALHKRRALEFLTIFDIFYRIVTLGEPIEPYLELELPGEVRVTRNNLNRARMRLETYFKLKQIGAHECSA